MSYLLNTSYNYNYYIGQFTKTLKEQVFQGQYTCVRGFEPPTPWSVAKCSIQLSYTHRTMIIIAKRLRFVKIIFINFPYDVICVSVRCHMNTYILYMGCSRFVTHIADSKAAAQII